MHRVSGKRASCRRLVCGYSISVAHCREMKRARAKAGQLRSPLDRCRRDVCRPLGWWKRERWVLAEAVASPRRISVHPSFPSWHGILPVMTRSRLSYRRVTSLCHACRLSGRRTERDLWNRERYKPELRTAIPHRSTIPLIATHLPPYHSSSCPSRPSAPSMSSGPSSVSIPAQWLQ